MTMDSVHHLVESPDFKRAYAIGNKHYEGEKVSADDQSFYNGYVNGLLDKDDLPFSIGIWLLYAVKYVT